MHAGEFAVRERRVHAVPDHAGADAHAYAGNVVSRCVLLVVSFSFRFVLLLTFLDVMMFPAQYKHNATDADAKVELLRREGLRRLLGRRMRVRISMIESRLFDRTKWFCCVCVCVCVCFSRAK
jgi:hypothetical protein